MINNLIFSIENTLTISRLMYDHAIVINAMTSFKNQEIINIFKKEQDEYGSFLLNYLIVSNQKITKEYINNEILVTKYTKPLEIKTSELSRIELDEKVTDKSHKLLPGDIKNISPDIKKNIKLLNEKLLIMLNNSVKKYTLLKKQIEEKLIVFYFDVKIINHFITETNSFIYTMDFLVKEMEFTPTYIYCMEYYLNSFEEEHLVILRNMMEPINPMYITHSDNTIEKTKKIIKTLNNNINPKSLTELNKLTLNAVNDFISWESELVASLVYKNYYNTIVIILYDHILREANYTKYLLKIFKDKM